jgi:uncharacterized repeat protein (TIGR01451 family)
MHRPTFLSLPTSRLARAAPVAAGLALAAAAATASAAQAAPTTPAQAAVTTTFTSTGAEQTYTVPRGATAVTITAVGAPGGSGLDGAAGGNGASVTATVPLPAGTSTLYVEVGGAGTLAGSDQGPTPGGFNGGGSGEIGGTGGGASDVRTCSMSTCTNLSANDTRLVVAGGGGGSGGSCGAADGAAGGAAGDSSVTGPGNGGAGTEPCSGAGPGGNSGLSGTAGGTGGAGAAIFEGSCAGGGGSLGQGGSGTFCSAGGAGGGGGGGYYGGGGGGSGVASGGGGGAGSSFWVTGATGTSMSEDTTGTPEVQITPIITAPDLSLSDNAPATAVSGDSYAYTLTATNTGGSDATGVAATDTLPASAHFTSATTSQGSCTRPAASKGGTVNCTVGSLAAGASVTITITVTATKPGTVIDATTVTAGNVTADADDSATATTIVTGT